MLLTEMGPSTFDLILKNSDFLSVQNVDENFF